jgi:Lrp/AsnC family leucine-responsive transcriptional regulator
VQGDASLTQSEIAERVGLSVGAVSERLKKLETRGVIRGYVALLDAKRLGKDICAFIQVLLEHPKFDQGFQDAMSPRPRSSSAITFSGSYSYLLKVKIEDTALSSTCCPPDQVHRRCRQTATIVVLSTSKEGTAIDLPLPREAESRAAGAR